MAEGRGDGGTIYAAESIQQRASTILRDVRYVIDAHFELKRSKMTPTDSARSSRTFSYVVHPKGSVSTTHTLVLENFLPSSSYGKMTAIPSVRTGAQRFGLHALRFRLP